MKMEKKYNILERSKINQNNVSNLFYLLQHYRGLVILVSWYNTLSENLNQTVTKMRDVMRMKFQEFDIVEYALEISSRCNETNV